MFAHMSHAVDHARLRVLVVGAGGQGRIAADIVLAGREHSGMTPVGFVDDAADLAGHTVMGLPVLGTLEQVPLLRHDGIVVAIGDNLVRERLTHAFVAAGERIVAVRHPFSSIAADVAIGDGAMISAGAVITPGASIGAGVIVNTKASIDHDSRIEPFAHAAPGSVIGAGVTIGARVLVGMGAVIMAGCRVGADSVIGAGALVHRDIPENVVAVGVPAQVRRAR